MQRLQKIRAAVVAAFAALFVFALPSVPAAAWDEVCVHFIAPKVWFDGKFQVVYGFDDIRADDARYSAYSLMVGRVENSSGGSYEVDPHYEHNDERYRMRGRAEWSPTMRSGNRRCVSIGEVRNGEKFAVFLMPGTHEPRNAILCETHRDNADLHYVQHDAPFRRLWYHVWGSVFSPRCAFHHEE